MDPRLKAFEDLLDVMDKLRAECPWDKKQTIASLRKLTIEETYELSDAIIVEDKDAIKEELGDIMLHLIFYSKIASEQNAFDITDVLTTIKEKLIYRHPHIYGNIIVADEEEVARNWEALKMKEGKKSVLEGVPRSMAPMVKAQRIQEKVKSVGFDWENKEQVYEKVEEELSELQEALAHNNLEEMEMELGDVFFALINYARFLNLDAEKALDKTNNKFVKRFKWMEDYIKKEKKEMSEMKLLDLDAVWNLAKRATK
jgi:XTP/dITP diphosphohydrolase